MIKKIVSGSSAAVALLALTANAPAQGVIFNVDFEAPTYSPGLIGAGNFPGQDNWYGFGLHFVTDSQAHTGGQSLTTTSGGSVRRAFTSQNGLMDIGKGHDWFIQTWVYVPVGASSDAASFAPGSSLGAAFYVNFTGDGQLYFNSGTVDQTQNIGSGLFNQWLCLTINHPANDPNLEMSVVGNGVNALFSGFYATPWSPSFLSAGGPTAYWDDMIAVDNAITPVPEPSTFALAGLGLALLAARRLRR